MFLFPDPDRPMLFYRIRSHRFPCFSAVERDEAVGSYAALSERTDFEDHRTPSPTKTFLCSEPERIFLIGTQMDILCTDPDSQSEDDEEREEVLASHGSIVEVFAYDKRYEKDGNISVNTCMGSISFGTCTGMPPTRPYDMSKE